MNNRQIDALIAERVMGWRHYKDDHNDGWYTDGSWRNADEWQPTTNIAAALEVAGRMSEQGVRCGG